ncbi:hypothetical protein GIB67_025453 [Kingdonia uniflora]|uniref:Uncharacterized protein n=1 Tax=Kingdonia uniflora TaxID=39325 RepID=A0A7J7N1W7_9MAGN|nr:hypothetical protein GIB67_025453 [Kingdonia uniflora]
MGIEHFQHALEISPGNVAAYFGLASGLLGLSKECVNNGAFSWGALLLEEASDVANASTVLTGNASCTWKLHGDIQLAYAKCVPWTNEQWTSDTIEMAYITSVSSWKNKRLLAAISARRSYQRALHLTPWEATLYTDVAISVDLISSLEEKTNDEPDAWQLPEKMALGGLLLEGNNSDFWVALGCLSSNTALKQHALIRGLQLDVSLAVAWAYLGKIYRKIGEKNMTRQAFDHARSIDPSLALPWAGMSADISCAPEESYESCLRAVQIMPLAEFQIGLAKLAFDSGHLVSSQAFGAIRQAVLRAPHYPESHNLSGLLSEARSDYQSAISAYRLARLAIGSFAGTSPKSHFNDISVNLARALCAAGNALDASRECEDLKKEGLLDTRGLQVYAVSLWQLGKHDLALSVARTLASSVSTIDQTTAAASISFIFKLMYWISGQESTTTSILKMPRELLKSSKISFIVSVIDALDHSNRLESVISTTRDCLTSQAEITGMHFVIALRKLLRHGSEHCLGIQSGVNHLRKALHMYPNSGLIRNLLGYLLLTRKEHKDPHIAIRCSVMDLPGYPVIKGLKPAYEILGAATISCYFSTTFNPALSFPTCKDQFLHGAEVIQQLQRCLHQEPWNCNARYLLLLNVQQKAREARFPRHLCVVLERLVYVSLSNKECSEYQRFHILLCASEICLQCGDPAGCIKHAVEASELSVPDGNLFFAHLSLCRAYAARDDVLKLQKEYRKCLQLKTDYPIGWICLKYLESRYKLQIDLNTIDMIFEGCLKENDISRNIWMSIFALVCGQSSMWNMDFLQAEEALSYACSLAPADSCLFLCHGAICMELVRKNRGLQFLSLAKRSLIKAQKTSPVPLPIVSALLAQTEASLGAKAKWGINLSHEWFSWPPEKRPAELYFQMYLREKAQKVGFDSSSIQESYDCSYKWILRAIHLNPSSSRYWKVLQKVWE